MGACVTLSAVTSFPLTGEPLALDLVNTVIADAAGGVSDLLDDDEAANEWFALHETELDTARGSPVARGDLVELREALRVLLQAATEGRRAPRRALAHVNAAAAGGHRALRWTAGGPQALWQGTNGGTDRAVLAAIAQSGIEVLTHDAGRLRRCGGPGCLLFFVATNPRRRWCSDRLCGNRVRVSRHRHPGSRA